MFKKKGIQRTFSLAKKEYHILPRAFPLQKKTPGHHTTHKYRKILKDEKER